MNSIVTILLFIDFLLGFFILMVGLWALLIFVSGKSKILIIILSLGFLGISSQNSFAYNPDPPLIGGAAQRANSYSGMKHDFRKRLDALYAALPREYRRGFGVTSGYRSEAMQNRLRRAPHKRGYVAMGKSHHTIGDAADLHASQGCFRWMHSHARQFGLYFPMTWERWHIQSLPGRHYTDETPLELLASLITGK